jgi:4-oxalocrotonate tautomerase
MPFVNIKLVDGVFSTDQKHAMTSAITEVMIKFEDSEALREIAWVLIENLHAEGWHVAAGRFRDQNAITNVRQLENNFRDDQRPFRIEG